MLCCANGAYDGISARMGHVHLVHIETYLYVSTSITRYNQDLNNRNNLFDYVNNIYPLISTITF